MTGVTMAHERGDRPRFRILPPLTILNSALTEESGVARSKLRAALAAGVVLTGCGTGDAEAGAWELRVDTVQAGGTGSARRTAWLRVVGQEGATGEARTTPVILSFDCRPDQASVTVMTRQALRQGTAEARLTLDQRPPLELPAFAGTTESGGQVVLTIPQDSLLELLARHQRAVVEYADGAGSSRTTAEFPLAGLATRRAVFLTACQRRGG